MTGPAFASVLSGLGFGLVAWLGFGLGAHSALFAWLSAPIALALALAALVSGGAPRPADFSAALKTDPADWAARERALGAAALAVFALYAVPWLLFGVRIGLVGFLATLAAGASVWASGVRLRAGGPARDTSLTPASLLLFALASGALGDAMLTDLTARDDGGRADGAAIFLLVAAFGVKWAWWERTRKLAGGADDLQARNARRAAVALGLIVPVVCIDLSGRAGAIFVPIGLAAHVAGLMIERRLFFAPGAPAPSKADDRAASG